jgi:hypothetical protein
VCIASWDNLTNKGLLRIEPELVLVWNEAQKREAAEYHYIAEDKIAVTGAQLFDRWFEKTITRDRDAFCQRVGLPDSSPFVLFTGSSSFISESSSEVAFVRRWIDALRRSSDPTLRTINSPRPAPSVQLSSLGGRTARRRLRRQRFPEARLQPDRCREPERLFRLALSLCGGGRHQHERDDRSGDRGPARVLAACAGVLQAPRKGRSTSTICCRRTAGFFASPRPWTSTCRN